MTDVTCLFDYDGATKEAVSSCPVCRRENPSVPATDRYGYEIGVSHCVCGLGYLNPRMSAEGYTEFYNGPYRQLVRAVGSDRRSPEALNYSQFQMGWALRHHLGVSDVPTILDAGGSTGALGRAVGGPAARVTVIDPCAHELTFADDRCVAVCATLEACPNIEPQDAILCVQTLDHLREPIAVLTWLRSCLRPGGWAYLDIVDAPRWAQKAKTATYQWKIDHPLYWTPATFMDAVKSTGWTIERTVRMGRHGTHYGVFCR